ncbi:helix-turn-helix domain-containing protein [Marinospirillum insulare]|uniref:HTH cro/C1-type domain-containing protein n=1 Tax=Marinospirillum insulare TaxID=217169 RepID=A0ABQ5ZW34_9GAMM|nr:helix-turn-helix transcriptional regulator [Marinospirillum insulare]GLR64390.1 hypothetical protein GCM10007878_18280 [Marinospirillum insulare]
MLLNQLSGLWQESIQDPEFRFELKAQKVSVDLASAFTNTGMSQKELAEKLGWRTSRVSKVLHGGSNLTLRTLFDICEAMQTDFDIEIDGQSQLKQEIEIVKMKSEQLSELIGAVWRKKELASTQQQPLVNMQAYSFAS